MIYDWRPTPDPRSDNFRFTMIPACGSLTTRTSVMRLKGIHLDQGQEGACTGFGAEHARALTPHSQKTSNDRARAIYHRARFLDEWPGEAYEGSSVNGAMKAQRELGLITKWYWAKTHTEVRHGLSYHGAGVAGTWWYDGMTSTDEHGFIHPVGGTVGGHAYAIAGYRVVNGVPAFRIENSWGYDWGDKGGAWIAESAFLTLLATDGEIAFPSKVRL